MSQGSAIFNVYRHDLGNVGDASTSPTLYFDWLKNTKILDIESTNFEAIDKQLRSACLIFGGGGMLAHFEGQMNIILRSRPRALVIWGAGHNIHEAYAIEFPEYMRDFDLVGIRDHGYGFDWVPCVSCLHDGLSMEYEPKYEIVVFEHKYNPLPIAGFPKLTNAGSDVASALRFLGSGGTILTNSYHGAYWGTLLNRRVVVVDPFSSKFNGLKYKVPIASGRTWKQALPRAQSYPDALRECRFANQRFARRVRELLVDRRALL
jgi:hypothetical protein